MEIKHIHLNSNCLREQRWLTVLHPDAPAQITDLPVVMCADGECLRGMYSRLREAMECGRIPNCVLVGVHSSTEFRAKEYIPGLDPVRFSSHEQFFTREALNWVRAEFSLSSDRNKFALFGVSNSAVFAITTGLRHNDKFATVIAFSVPGGASRYRETDWDTIPHLSFYLAAGNRELPIEKTTRFIAKKLKQQGVRHVYETRPAGHDFEFWAEELPLAIRWAFNEKPQP